MRIVPLLVASLLLLGGGMWLGGHPSSLPEPLRDAFVEDEASRLVDEALEHLEDEYFRPLDRGELVDAAVAGIVRSLDDRFSAYFDPATYREFQRSTDGRYAGVGVNVQEDPRGLLVVAVFGGSPAKRAGIRAGDVVVAVDGKDLEGRPSRYSTALIKGRPGTPVRLTLRRGARRLVETVVRAEVDVPQVDGRIVRREGRRLGHVRLASFTSGVHGQLRATIGRLRGDGARGIVLDLRGNGGGLLNEAVLVASAFLPEGKIVVTTRARASGERVLRSQGEPAVPAGFPVAVLVDRGSASASEIVAGALQDHRRARVVGTRTFGKGVFQQVAELANGGALDFTVGQYFTPKGRNLGGGGVKQGAGITPDRRAKDVAKTRRDEALRAALALLDDGTR